MAIEVWKDIGASKKSKAEFWKTFKSLATSKNAEDVKAFVELLKTVSPEDIAVYLYEHNAFDLSKFSYVLSEYIGEDGIDILKMGKKVNVSLQLSKIDYELLQALASQDKYYHLFRKLAISGIYRTLDVKENTTSATVSKRNMSLYQTLSNEEYWKLMTHKEIFDELESRRLVLTRENIWQAIEYFSREDSRFVKFLTSNMYLSVPAIYRHYENVDRFELPKGVAQFLENIEMSAKEEQEKQIRIERNRKATGQKNRERILREKEERMQSWFDKDGKLLKFFSIGGMEIETYEDYFKIYEKFVESNMSIYGFCKKYKISSEVGFKKLLDKLSYLDTEIAEEITRITAANRQKFKETALGVVDSITSGEMTVSEFFAKPFAHHLINMKLILKFAREYSQNKDSAEIVADKIVRYYFSRLNDYQGTIEPEDVVKKLKLSEVSFITGLETSKALQGKQMTMLESLFRKNLQIVRGGEFDGFGLMLSGDPEKSITTLLQAYNEKYRRRDYPQFFGESSDAEEIKTLDEQSSLGKALQFARMHRLYLSKATVDSLVQAAEQGKLDTLAEVMDERLKMKQQIQSLIKEARTLEQYFEAIDSSRLKS